MGEATNVPESPATVQRNSGDSAWTCHTPKARRRVSAGDNLMDIAQAEDLEMEGPSSLIPGSGFCACGGSCACSTCHVIVEDPDMYDAMPEPSDDENDMLDLAFGLTETSRLGCQVKMSKEIDGVKIRLPSMTRNLQAADFKGAKKS
ncbi:MAG: hypothetical protein L6R40_004586 [Gallowayella cf. fulva]|nr:MAG: hypothetical protein L6R40_004586 [Xanthomendoza cf. fulva]